jgi:Fic-DOC domain mobile mystery protein B
MKFEYAAGATPLDPDETNALIPVHITTQIQLNEWEAANILQAENWLTSLSSDANFLTIDFIKLLHKKMFGETWKWAGVFRNTAKNIGIDSHQITTELKKLLDDIIFQIIHNSYPIDEIAFRFHHRLVLIHPFPNGNGRHARMMTDILLTHAGQPRFTWGKQKLEAEGPLRDQYITALKNADKQNYTALAKFVRS